MQTRLIKKEVKYHLGRYNQIRGDMQKIRLSEGCPHDCPFCHEPTKEELYFDELDKIKTNKVIFSDMNFLSKKDEAIEIIETLGYIKVNNKNVYYEFECGVDYRFLTQEIANALFKSRFGNFNKDGVWKRDIKIAWDWHLDQQYKIKDAVDMLIKAGYKPKEISVFMIVNWIIPLWECDLKLDLLKIWNVIVNDCCYDGGYKIAIAKDWTEKELKYFRHKCAIHNQAVLFGLYGDLKRALRIKKYKI